jgi:AraC-like DNA-binding protein
LISHFHIFASHRRRKELLLKQYLLKSYYQISFEKGQIPHLFNLYKIFGNLDSDIRCLHAHENALELEIIRSGSCISIVDGCPYKLKAGDIQIINAGMTHEQNFGIDSDLVAYSVGIKNLHIKGLRGNALIPDNIYPVFRLKDFFDDICDLFDLITLQLDRNYIHATETANYLMIAFLSLFLNVLSTEPTTPLQDRKVTSQEMIVQKACQYINENYRNNIALQDIAKHANVDKYYLTRAFKKVLGYPPIQYLIRRRIGEAQFQLVETSKPISEIATEVGFNTLSHFSTTFSKILKTSPQKYRSEVLTKYYENPRGQINRPSFRAPEKTIK